MSIMTSSETESVQPAPDQTGAGGLGLPISAGTLAGLLDAMLIGNADVQLGDLGSIETGTSSTLTFIRSKNYAKLWADSNCGCALVSEDIEVPDHDPEHRALIIVPDADEALVKLLAAINPDRARPDAGVHPSAVIHASARVDSSAAIGPGCVVGSGTSIGAGAVLMANITIGVDVQLGDGTILEPGVVIEDRCVIGQRCVIGANSVIGSDGFGYLPPTEQRGAIKVPQIGTVEIGDDVELGACVTVDRAKFGATTIGHRTKIDNQVHIAHNCVIGSDALICGRTTLGGSSSIGDHAMVGGAVVVNDHARIGANTRVAGGAMVLELVPDGETYAGVPAMPARKAMQNYGAARDLGVFVRSVEKRLNKLESDDSSK
jgi:UDP-3-O-[3-hydroxymyristoyl] glucosamine N-acyltransferase